MADSDSGRHRRRRKRKHRAGPEPFSPPAGTGWAMAAIVGIAGYALWTMLGGGAKPPESSIQHLAPVADVPGVAASAPAREQYSGDRAYDDLKRQVQFGPRVPNMPGHKKCLDYLVKTLQPLADSMQRQDFSQSIRGTRLVMTNVIARWRGKGGTASAGKSVLLCGHWDTRPTADYDSNPANRRKPIPGANDGASEVAVLLELARVFKRFPPPVPVTVVFFDGEDYGPGIADMFLGSTYFAAHLPNDVPRRGVLLDMIGDKDLVIPREAYSMRVAPEVVADVYGAAHRLGYDRSFPAMDGQPIEDDHLPLQRRGLKVIDLIDFDYGPGHSWWHTLDDTPDKCSALSLKQVGDTMLEWIVALGS